MRIELFFTIFFVLLIFGNPDAYAQSITDDATTTVQHENDPPEIDLYVPEHMIVGSQYHGMLTYPQNHDNIVLGIIAANQDAISVDASIPVMPYEDHGLFEITPRHAGIFTISVKVDGITVQKSVTISDGIQDNSLLLVVPASTRAENVLGAVYLVDDANRPVIADDTFTVSLAGSSGIILPDTVTISNGSTGATFQIHAQSSGTISASSGVMHDSTTITSESEKLKLVMDVYPKIMRENSFGYYFLWFENEDGMPHIPNGVTVASIHSSDKDIARMDLKITAELTSQSKNTFSDGVTYGRIFTGNSGIASITASVPGYGSATSEFLVGPASFGTVTITNTTSTASTTTEHQPSLIAENKDRTLPPSERLDALSANDIRFGVIPPVTVSEGYVIAGLYHSITDQSIEIDSDNIETTRETTDIYPVSADARKVYITSDGARHNSVEILDTADIPTHVNLYEIGGTPGKYRVSVSSPEVISHEPEEFVITGDSSDAYHIEIIALPALPGHVQDLAMIYVADSQGMAVSPKNVFGGGITIHLESESVFLDSNFVNLNESVGIVRGAYSEGMTNQITAYAGMLERVTQNVGVTSADSGNAITIDAPDTVHSHEAFAASAHLIRDSKAVSDVTYLMEAGGGCQKDDDAGLFVCDYVGTLSVFSDVGNGEVTINPYLTPIDASFQYSFDGGGSMSVGKNYTITATVPEGSVLSVDTAISHTIHDNTITLSPDTTGKYEIIVDASRPGMISHYESISVEVDDSIEVSILARDSDGISIGVEGTISGTGTRQDFITDHTGTVPGGSSITVEFPQSARHGDYGYRLTDILLLHDDTKGVTHQGNAVTFAPEHGHTITANYERVILIDVVGGGVGGGVYGVGDTVTVSAPPKDTMAFLVREVLDHWEGIDSADDNARFVATKDLTVIPVYRTDYTGAVAVFGVMAMIVLAASFRGNDSYRLRISQITDLVGNGIGAIQSVILPRKKKKVEKPSKDEKPESS